MTTSVTVLQQIKPSLRWFPASGECTEDFLRRKSKDPNGPSYDDLTSHADSVLVEAQRILGRCLPPTEDGAPATGLVVGYVQSGKTMSFETVIALARDNGFGLVIVLAGTQNLLRDQSEDRLKKDLGIDDGDEHWHLLSNPTSAKHTEAGNKLDAWKKKAKKSLLVTVLKNRTRIDGLKGLLDLLNGKLTEVPALIIDDESDQASLNTKAARIKSGKSPMDAMSETYRAIQDLRGALPRHSYLQYTATPQANLLLAQADFLNPDFAELVTPGRAYTGGKAFFKQNRGLICDIPTREVPTPANNLTTPPKSLLASLRFFLLAAAHHALLRMASSDRKKDRNRSMMVHPSQATASHKTYKKWVDKALKGLRTTVEGMWGSGPAARSNPSAVRKLFEAEYRSLKATHPAIKPLDELLDKMVDDVFDELNAVEVNGTPDAEKKIDWKANRYWILVGGMKLDRGYTVEGLCVTYMPRPLGGAPAADTLQQRARFFGYKSSYLGTCRVFLQTSVWRAFTDYVEHEEFVRGALEDQRGKPLSAWRRDFILTQLLRPTRPNVVGLGVRRIPVDGWLVPSVLQRDADAAATNRALLVKLRAFWTKKYGAPVSAATVVPHATKTTHTVFEGLPLSVVLDFLLDVQVKDPQDSEEHAAMLIALGVLVAENPGACADVFLMNDLKPGYRTRAAGRGVGASQKYAPINQYFSQSAETVNDRDFRSASRVCLQLRRFDLGTHQRDPSRADIRDVAWFALNVPKPMMKALVVQVR